MKLQAAPIKMLAGKRAKNEPGYKVLLNQEKTNLRLNYKRGHFGKESFNPCSDTFIPNLKCSGVKKKTTDRTLKCKNIKVKHIY